MYISAVHRNVALKSTELSAALVFMLCVLNIAPNNVNITAASNAEESVLIFSDAEFRGKTLLVWANFFTFSFIRCHRWHLQVRQAVDWRTRQLIDEHLHFGVLQSFRRKSSTKRSEISGYDWDGTFIHGSWIGFRLLFILTRVSRRAINNLVR